MWTPFAYKKGEILFRIQDKICTMKYYADILNDRVEVHLLTCKERYFMMYKWKRRLQIKYNLT